MKTLFSSILIACFLIVSSSALAANELNTAMKSPSVQTSSITDKAKEILAAGTTTKEKEDKNDSKKDTSSSWY